MTAKTATTTSREALAKSVVAAGMMSADEIQLLWRSLPADHRPKTGDELLEELRRRGKVTAFQAEAISAGAPQSLRLGEYLLLDKLGAGGMGQVYRAVHRRMDRIVALKVLPPKVANDPEAIQRFQREVRAAAKLSHPHVVTAYDAGAEGHRHYLVMEYVDGRDLAAVVQEDGPLPVAAAVDCLLQAARGLAYAHSKGVVHRDIKPANLLLDREGVVKILDMGLARFEAAGGDRQNDQLTTDGQVMGTVDYMSPEQAANTRDADARSDLYSLGCTFYRLLTGESPYFGETIVQRILAHVNHPVPTIRAKRPETPVGVDAIFQKLVAKRPEERYQLATELIADLEQLRADSLAVAKERAEAIGLKAFAHSPRATPAAMAEPRKSPAAAGTMETTPRLTLPAYEAETTGNLATSDRPAAPLITPQAQPQTAGKRSARRPGLFIALGCAGLLLLLAGVIVVIRNKEGKVVARVPVPEGGNVGLEVENKEPSNATPSSKRPPVAPVIPIKPATADEQAALERRVAEWAINKGGSVVPQGHSAVTDVKQLPAESFYLASLSLKEMRLTEEEAARLGQLARIHEIVLEKVELSPAAAAHLVNCKRLRVLRYLGLAGSPEIFKALARIKQLRVLDLARTRVSDECLADFAKMPCVEHLNLSFGMEDSLISDAGLEILAAKAPPKLAHLDLARRNITARGMAALSKLRHLSHLGVTGWRFDKDGPSEMNDEAILKLAPLSSLSVLEVSSSDVTSQGTTALYDANPGILIKVDRKEQMPRQLTDGKFEQSIRSLQRQGFVFTLNDKTYANDDWAIDGPVVAWSADWAGELTPAAAKELANVSTINDLSLYWSPTKASVPSLRSISGLRNLTTFYGDVGDNDLSGLAEFPKLRFVHSRFPGDASLLPLTKMPHITNIAINYTSTEITEAGLKPLMAIPTLNKVETYTLPGVSREFWQQFADARPDVDVYVQLELIEPRTSLADWTGLQRSP
jgi:hypothetical protein